MHDIMITTECVADLPPSVLEKKNIKIIDYDVKTEEGLFRDTDEVDAGNLMEYMTGGKKKAQSVVPGANDYKNFFRKRLEECDELIHICISGGISVALEHAKLGRAKLGVDGHRVHLIDSKHLSSGLGLLVLEALRFRDEGLDSASIIKRVEETIPRIRTSFLSNNADYLYYNGKVGKNMMKLCKYLQLHPVLYMKNGVLTLKRVYVGDYHRASSRYIEYLLRDVEQIEKQTAFVTYAGCGHEVLSRIQREVYKYVPFQTLWEQQASATVSCNCGPLTFGVLFIAKEAI